MKKITRTYVKFYYVGSFVSETTIKKIRHRDPSSVKVPDSAYSFMFYDQEFVVDGDTEFTGNIKNRSPDYYPEGKLYSQEEVLKLRNSSTLLSNMKYNKWEYVIKSRAGNFQPYEEGETVLI